MNPIPHLVGITVGLPLLVLFYVALMRSSRPRERAGLRPWPRWALALFAIGFLPLGILFPVTVTQAVLSLTGSQLFDEATMSALTIAAMSWVVVVVSPLAAWDAWREWPAGRTLNDVMNDWLADLAKASLVGGIVSGAAVFLGSVAIAAGTQGAAPATFHLSMSVMIALSSLLYLAARQDERRADRVAGLIPFVMAGAGFAAGIKIAGLAEATGPAVSRHGILMAFTFFVTAFAVIVVLTLTVAMARAASRWLRDRQGGGKAQQGR